jgi:hypothetical protein
MLGLFIIRLRGGINLRMANMVDAVWYEYQPDSLN